MAHQTERNIPHLRDIFGFHDKKSAKGADKDKEKDKDKGYEIGGYRGGRDWDEKSVDSSSISTNGGNDSAISVGSTSEEELAEVGAAGKKKKKRRDGSEPDVKHLERHLSMKKTIRKKIMRDLQQAFVEDPNEFRVEDITHEQLKAELNLQSLSFGGAAKKKGKKSSGESNFLDFLRTGSGDNKSSGREPVAVPQPERPEDTDSGHGSPPRARSPPPPGQEDDEDNRKVSFWRRFTIKSRTKR